MSVSIIIPTKDRGAIFLRTFEAACSAMKDSIAEIIVINDSKTFELNISKWDNVKVLNNPASGVASARNLGAANARYDYLLFLDDDIIINKNNLDDAVKFMASHPNSTLNTNWTYPPELMEVIKTTSFGRFLIANRYTDLEGWHRNLFWDGSKIFECELSASYFLMIRKTDFNKVSGYNEVFPHAGAEDFDFAKRLKSNGIITYINPESTVLHNEADRIDLQKWLIRKGKSAETRRIAMDMGHDEMNLVTTSFKKLLVLFMYNFKTLFFIFAKLVPNRKRFDFLYFRIVNTLFAIYLYKGFFKNK